MKIVIVKFHNESNGFGFVVDAETQEEHFVHVSGLNGDINEGDNVEFELKDGKKGLNAVNVTTV